MVRSQGERIERGAERIGGGKAQHVVISFKRKVSSNQKGYLLKKARREPYI